MDFSAEDLYDTIDRIVAAALSRCEMTEPPVDALRLADLGFGFRIEYADPIDPAERRYGDQSKKKRYSPDTIVLRDDMTEESQHLLAARAIARRLLPEILTRLGVHPEADNRQANTQIVSLIAPRLLLPSRWFSGDAGRAGFDLVLIKERYPTVGFETIALRLLDLDDPCVIAIVDDDGTIAARRSNSFQAPRRLTEAEQACRELIVKTGEPAKTKGSGWIVRGWPTPGVPFRRIVMRSIPEDV
jgi:predicted transcriptional regulator